MMNSLKDLARWLGDREDFNAGVKAGRRRPILSLDFDGVLHAYTSGWKGFDVIPDGPVPGAMQFLTEMTGDFEVHIFSSRSRRLSGRRAMRNAILSWLSDHIGPDRAIEVGARLHWPWFKPGAFVAIDDRCLTFTGAWPRREELLNFKPWNK